MLSVNFQAGSKVCLCILVISTSLAPGASAAGVDDGSIKFQLLLHQLTADVGHPPATTPRVQRVSVVARRIRCTSKAAITTPTITTIGKLLDQAFIKRADKFLDELVWMAKTLRYGRDNIALDS